VHELLEACDGNLLGGAGVAEPLLCETAMDGTEDTLAERCKAKHSGDAEDHHTSGRGVGLSTSEPLVEWGIKLRILRDDAVSALDDALEKCAKRLQIQDDGA